MTRMNESMPMTAAITEQVLNEVNAFLDSQTRYVEETLARLDHLRASVIRRDEGALNELFQEVEQETTLKQRHDRAISELRRKLSVWLGCPAEHVCLSRVCDRMEPQARKDVAARQAALQGLIRRLSNEHRATQALLHECARFNRLLLNSLFGNRQQTATYDARGLSRWNVQGGLMNVRF